MDPHFDETDFERVPDGYRQRGAHGVYRTERGLIVGVSFDAEHSQQALDVVQTIAQRDWNREQGDQDFSMDAY